MVLTAVSDSLFFPEQILVAACSIAVVKQVQRIVLVIQLLLWEPATETSNNRADEKGAFLLELVLKTLNPAGHSTPKPVVSQPKSIILQ